ncbi:MAG TPA: RlpA-like double-psi beta-barrel domain-containing protein [Verrucomicrobiales bacterium]|nr:RlpA-like double-psi beta-barrel domain-containing protein [Verrucomicrobiales bacterium]
MRHVLSLVVTVVLSGPGMLFSQTLERGLVSVYADQLQGRQTASGALYDRGRLSAAHGSVPFGSIVRVANSQTGRYVDVVVNDRKAPDGRMIVLSRAAADALQLPLNAVAEGSMMIIGQASSPVSSPGPRSVDGSAVSAGPSRSYSDSAPAERKFRPFGGIFGKEDRGDDPPVGALAGQSAGASFSKPGQVARYGIPSGQYQPPLVAPSGTAVGNELMPMNARAPGAGGVSGYGVRSPSQAAMRPASPAAPYRVQFGAFRRSKGADELAGMLGEAGIPVSVFSATTTGLNVVVTNAGFPSAEEAQRWIDFEGIRRGWKEMPVVIR